MPPKQILLSAGEASGDMYAAQLAKALKARTNCEIFGMGGEQMRAAGVDVVSDYSQVSVLGITEILGHLPQLIRAMRGLVNSARVRRPALAILTDFPGFHLRLARKLKSLSVRNVYYICPQFWAWRPWRVRIVKRRFALALCIFPFEEKFFADAGVPVKFIGHPLVGNVAPSQTRQGFFAAHGLDPAKPLVTILPGSRNSEIARHLPILAEACAKIQSELPVQFVLASAPGCAASLRQNWPGGIKVLIVEGQTYDALAHANASVVASGTATVQAAVIGNPFVVVYRVSPLTFRLAKRLVRYPPEIWNPAQVDVDGNLPIAMVNLIAGSRIVPELLQTRFTAENVAAALQPLLADSPERDQMIANLAEVRRALQPPPGTGSIPQVCDAVEALLAGKSPVSGPNSTASV